MSDTAYPDTIELERTSEGVYVPNFEAATPAPIEVYRREETYIPFDPPPPPAPTYDSGSRGLSDADLADFGTDAFGRPVMTRNPVTGRAEFNPEVDYAGPSFEGPQRGADFVDRVPDSRRNRRAVGEAIESLGLAGEVLETAFAVQGALDFGSSFFWDAVGLEEGWFNNLFPGLDPNNTGAPTGEVQAEGEPEFSNGQCDLTRYIVNWTYTQSGGFVTTQNLDSFYGPIRGLEVVQANGRTRVFLHCRGAVGLPVRPDGYRHQLISAASIYDPMPVINFVTAKGNDPDSCGDPAGPTSTQPSTPPATPSTDYPPDYRNPEQEPETTEDDLPDSVFPELPDIDLPDFPDLPGLPDPENITDDIPEEQEEPPDTDPPTGQDDCCATNKLSLEEVLRRLDGEGEGDLDITPCADESTAEGEEVTQELVPYGGLGLAGIYSAIAAIEASLNAIHSNTKCPPETTAALPMVWSAKTGEIEQLVILWKPAEGGGSRWAMSVPHPRASITNDFEFSFPTYRKGRNMATMRLRDNSSVIVNVFSRQDAQDVLSYVRSLIDPQYLTEEELSFVYSENVSTNRELDVVATYAKKFAGHKDTAPLWAVEIN